MEYVTMAKLKKYPAWYGIKRIKNGKVDAVRFIKSNGIPIFEGYIPIEEIEEEVLRIVLNG